MPRSIKWKELVPGVDKVNGQIEAWSQDYTGFICKDSLKSGGACNSEFYDKSVIPEIITFGRPGLEGFSVR